MKKYPYQGSLRHFLTVVIAAFLAGIVTSSVSDVIAGELTKSRLKRQDSEQRFLKLGYTELSGEEAVRFLIGNTIVIRKADAPKWMLSAEDKRYYFSNAQNVIVCKPVETSCYTSNWTMMRNKICIVLPCDDDTPYSENARVLKAPRLNERGTGQIGIYITHKDNVQSIVLGNATVANFTDTNQSAKPMEVRSSEFLEEIRAAKEKPDATTEINVEGAHAAPILIGNTFMTDETTTDEHGNGHLCPSEGYYYSPDGRLIEFQCRDNDKWSILISRWRLKSGTIGVQDDEDPKKFDYGGSIQSAVLVPSGKNNLWHIKGSALGAKETLGYLGNTLNFR